MKKNIKISLLIVIALLLVLCFTAIFEIAKNKVATTKIQNNESDKPFDNTGNENNIEKNYQEGQNGIEEMDIEKCENKAQDLIDYEIPELGIKFKVNKELGNDLIYFYKEKKTMLWGGTGKLVGFSTNSLMKNSKYCDPVYAPLGEIVRIEGKGENSEFNYSMSQGFKQFKGFFVFYIHPQAPCTKGDTAIKVESPQLQCFSSFVEEILLID